MGVEFDNTSFQSKDDKKDKSLNYVSELRIIGVVVTSHDNVAGYVILNERTQQFKMYNIQQTKALLQKFKFKNAELDNRGAVYNTECSMDRLLKFNVNMQPVGNFGITILSEVHDKSDKLIAYRAMDANGRIADITEKELLMLIDSGNNLLNAKVVTKDNKSYISAIKSEFSSVKVDTSTAKQRLAKKEEVTPADKWRFERHRNKIMNKWLRKQLEYNMVSSENIGNTTHIQMYTATKRMNEGVNYEKEVDIVCKEIAASLNLSERNKQILVRARKEINISNHFKYVSRENADNDELMACVLSQLFLLTEGGKEYIFKKCTIGFKPSSLLKEIKDRGYMFEETALVIKELSERHANYINNKFKYANGKKFKTYDFRKAEDIAQLGFAISAKNDGMSYTTKTESVFKLKYVGNYLRDFDYFMQDSKCLGDVLALAYIDRILGGDYDSCLYGGDKATISEIILAFVAINNPTLCKKYIDKRIGEFKEMSHMLPDFDFEAPLSYGIEGDALKLYYESGFCVFYNDDGQAITLNDMAIYRSEYKRVYLREAEIINYRSLGHRHYIAHSILYKEFAPIINMITSDVVTPEDITKHIGMLRFL
jgi:hypothetical protein